MIYRIATIADIQQIQVVRNAVKENTLSDPNLVTDKDCEEFLVDRGKGWVCEIDAQIVGFAIADLKEDNVWALFVHPDFAQQGIGKKLQQLLLTWYFDHDKERIWLGTSPQTRAEEFYRRSGWQEIGQHGKGEIKFAMRKENWAKANA